MAQGGVIALGEDISELLCTFLNTRPSMLSGHPVLRALILERDFFTLAGDRESMQSSGMGGCRLVGLHYAGLGLRNIIDAFADVGSDGFCIFLSVDGVNTSQSVVIKQS